MPAGSIYGLIGPNGAGYPEIAVVYAPQRGRLGAAGSAGARDKIQVNIPIALAGRNRELLESELVAIHITAEVAIPGTRRGTGIHMPPSAWTRTGSNSA